MQVQRIVSHCRFERVPAGQALAWAESPAFPRNERIQRGTAVVDNFYTRSLLGKGAYAALPPGGVTRAHAAEAIAALAKFDAVLILETLDRSFDQLFWRLGWCRPRAEELRQTFGPGDETVRFDAGQKRRLAALNAPDLAVYAFARDLARVLERQIPRGASRGAARIFSADDSRGGRRGCGTWIFRGGTSRGRRRCRVDRPRRRRADEGMLERKRSTDSASSGRLRRGGDADIPWRRVTPGRGGSIETGARLRYRACRPRAARVAGGYADRQPYQDAYPPP